MTIVAAAGAVVTAGVVLVAGGEALTAALGDAVRAAARACTGVELLLTIA
ncbi:MAG: hypothetical protein ACLP50_26190 [Solirubrobacteraceae bacterium]